MSRIRSALLHDLPGAYRVCLQTGDSGRDASALYRNPDLLGHVFVGPYIVGQPELAFVVSDDEGVAGYVVAAESRAFEQWAEANWWPPLRRQYPVRDGDSRDERAIRLLHHPPREPAAVVAAYPAHLHINLLQRVQGQGLGRALIERLLDALRRKRSPGLHLDVSTANPNAIAFYRHVGFSELDRTPYSVSMGMDLS